MNVRADYGPADFDLRHRVVATIGYDIPFMKSNRWIGGWGVNSIISWQTGHPFSPYTSSSAYDLNKDGHRTDRLVPTKAPMDTVLSSSPGNGYFDIAVGSPITRKDSRYTRKPSAECQWWRLVRRANRAEQYLWTARGECGLQRQQEVQNYGESGLDFPGQLLRSVQSSELPATVLQRHDL